jgi:hypothetical protein
MENAKKLLLVDPARAAELYRPTITDKKLGALDQQVSDVLSSNMPDDQKAKRYCTILKAFRDIENRDIPKYDSDSTILNSVPSNIRPKAKRLLKHIKPFARWNDEGEIAGRDSLVPYSSLSDLLTETVTEQGAAKQPKGWREFADVLKTARTPRDLIPNQKLWTYMNPKSKRTIKKRRWLEYDE